MKVLIFLSFLLLTSSTLWSYPWPMKNAQGNFNGPLPVSATLGDYRYTQRTQTHRLHRGIDIAKTGTVYSISSGIARWDNTAGVNARVRVGDYWYIHLTPHNRIRNGQPVTGILDNPNNPTRIGDVAGNHLHFQIGSYVSGGPYINPLNYNGDRPVNYTDPDDSHGRPIVYSVNLFREYADEANRNRPEEVASDQLTSPIYGLVEIRGRCQDRQYSANSLQHSGIYRTEWLITDTFNNTIYGPFETIRFSSGTTA